MRKTGYQRAIYPYHLFMKIQWVFRKKIHFFEWGGGIFPPISWKFSILIFIEEQIQSHWDKEGQTSVFLLNIKNPPRVNHSKIQTSSRSNHRMKHLRKEGMNWVTESNLFRILKMEFIGRNCQYFSLLSKSRPDPG